MKKEEAIKYLQQLYPNGGHCRLDEQRIEAIGMAVKALQEELESEDEFNETNFKDLSEVTWSEDDVQGMNAEYVRTDAFIDKALKWYCLDCECNDNCNADHKCFFRQEYKRYLEGNDNAVPPKFDNAILPDENAEKNYRYRHFIRKMQDAFIEKAVSYIQQNWIWNTKIIEDFKKYMKGE